MTSYVDIFDRGYHNLVSVIPPGGELSAGSTIKPESLGKIPGRHGYSGWYGYNHLIEPTPDRNAVQEIERSGANLGMQGTHFPAIDIDCDNPDVAARVLALATEYLGWAPRRDRNNSAHCLLVYRTAVPFPKHRVVFDVGGTKQAIDVLGAGQQYLIEGLHPSGSPYEWTPEGLAETPPSALTAITIEQVRVFLEAVHQCYPDEWNLSATGAGEDVPQDTLRGDVATLGPLLEQLPNTVRDRTTYISMGCAIKAALGEEGFDYWWGWCQRLPDARKSEADARAEWSRMNPPFQIGASWLLDLARQHALVPVREFETAVAPVAVTATPTDRTMSGAASYSDAWLADAFLVAHGHAVRHCTVLGGWLAWDGSCWATDDLHRVNAWVGAICREKAEQAPAKELQRLASSRIVQSVMEYARSDTRVARPVTDFDLDPWALNTPRGIIDLHTGEVRANDSSRMMTRCTSVPMDPTMTPRHWLRFLEEATRDNPALVAYLQRLAGYALTGSTNEHVMAFFHGSGGNGKGTFLNTLGKAIGTYAKAASMETFTASRFDRHPADLATLVGARMVTAQETQEGRAWDETKIKAITGGDPITARFMRENPFTYKPQFTLLFAGNHRPHLTTVDDAMRRRLHLVPFTAKPKVVDRELDEKLALELPGILAWAVQGALRWKAEGLNPPPVVVAATREYFLSEDPFGRWLAESTVPSAAGSEVTPLFVSWRGWSGTREVSAGSQVAFENRLRDRELMSGERVSLELRDSVPPVETFSVHTTHSHLLD